MVEAIPSNPIDGAGFFKNLVDHMEIGVIIGDAEGKIVYINQTYARFLDIDIQASLGKHATQVISNSRLHIVAKTGMAEINHPHRFNDTGFLVHRVPLFENGRLIAVVGMVLFDSATTAAQLAQKLAQLESKLVDVQKELARLHSATFTFDSIAGKSGSIKKSLREAAVAADTSMPVLITGESGTGKELFAHAIHQASNRRAFPFIRVNCSAMPRDLLESELFGYEKGSFTGAHPKGKPGKFELAHLGTIFLDEIGDMPLDMQPKLLRVLELKEFERVGGVKVISSDFRVISATNQNLEQLMKTGQFRRDLYYRISGLPVEIAPLRERREDIVPIAYHFIEKTLKGPAGKAIRIHPAAQKALERYDWPGNARELCNVMQRALYRATAGVIRSEDLPGYLGQAPDFPRRSEATTLSGYMRAAERLLIEQTLKQVGGNKTKAADLLGIHRTLLYRKIKLLGLKG
ncbi:MAG TPA: AAA family ATPase [Desulfobacteraceae bacterium]|nr:sigma 54-interacting transcriptional regulator [Deltaproteobacteria bacterium]HDI59498.1 AAA family ATPase [Desulfobacteraceae bacterium]